MHAGATDRNNNTLPYAQQAPSTLPTIWDLLLDKNISCTSYFSDLPITGLWGDKYKTITKPFEQFLADAAAGQLPSVSYFDPNFGFSAGESYGVSRDDHPHADIRDGQVYLTEIYNALRASENWDRTLMIVTYDEWGGFFDHVVPPSGPVSEAEGTFNDGTLGFRTPCCLIGPRARRGHVAHQQFDPGSLLNLIRWRFGLGSLCARDNWSQNFALALDFLNPANTAAPAFGQLSKDQLDSRSRAEPWGQPCFLTPVTAQTPLAEMSVGQRSWLEHQNELRPLYEMSKAYGLI
jgi:phospholipase C